MLLDKFGRKISYLRLAVTDRCNLRCRYCMPEEGIDFASRRDILSYEEIIKVCSLLSSQGVKKIRLTGGEPFVRKDIIYLIEKINPLFDSLNITSNATFSKHHLSKLHELKIDSLNISLDTLNKENFERITRRDQFDKVYKNILTAIEEGINVKINVVVMKGVNENEIVDFVDFGVKNIITVRFIEAMPFNASDGNRSQFFSINDIYKTISEHYSLKKIESETPSSSMSYQIDGTASTLGLIPAYSRLLCGSCDRIRLTAKGELRNCLYSSSGLDLRNLLRSGHSDEDVLKAIQDRILKKKKNGFEAEAEREKSIAFESMTTIGG